MNLSQPIKDFFASIVKRVNDDHGAKMLQDKKELLKRLQSNQRS